MISPFQRLPISCDLARVQIEVAQFSPDAWLSHPEEIAGTHSLSLISVGGTRNIDVALSGPMAITLQLRQSSYLCQLLASLDVPLSRCRLVRLPAQSVTKPQLTATAHAYLHSTILIPVVSDEQMVFQQAEQNLSLTAGQAYLLNPQARLALVNDSHRDAIHLLIETKDRFPTAERQANRLLSYAPDQTVLPQIAPYRFEPLTPDQIDQLTTLILDRCAEHNLPDKWASVAQAIGNFCTAWRARYEQFGEQLRGELAYLDLIVGFEREVATLLDKWKLGDDEVTYALGVIRTTLWTAPRKPRPISKLHMLSRKRLFKVRHADLTVPDFDRPLFIISPPRAGSTLLFETLGNFAELWSIGDESHALFEGLPALHPSAHNDDSNCLSADDATPEIAEKLRARFARQLINRGRKPYLEYPVEERPRTIRLLEKTPKNALRIPFLKAAFPNARFIYLYRNPAENISSMLEGWRLQRFLPFFPYQQLPGWPYRDWSFLIVPGWRTMIDRPVVEVAAYQWRIANETILADVAELPADTWHLVRYQELIQQPRQTIEQLAAFAGLTWNPQIEQVVADGLPISSMTVSTPDRQKWRKNGWLIEPLLPELDDVVRQVEALR